MLKVNNKKIKENLIKLSYLLNLVMLVLDVENGYQVKNFYGKEKRYEIKEVKRNIINTQYLKDKIPYRDIIKTLDLLKKETNLDLNYEKIKKLILLDDDIVDMNLRKTKENFKKAIVDVNTILETF